VRAYNVYFYFLRINKGVETVLMVTAYYAFYFEVTATKEIPSEEVKFEDYYIFGSSL
jgi:hypothetical protein